MNTTTTLSRITLTVAILISNAMISFANNKQQDNFHSLPTNKKEICSINQQDLASDTYIMVMQQQVEKGDQSITYSFYIDQLTDIYKIAQLTADIDITLQMIETANMK